MRFLVSPICSSSDSAADIPTCEHLDHQFPASAPKASDVPLFNPYTIDHAIQTSLKACASTSGAAAQQVVSRFGQANHPALGKSLPAPSTFHRRIPELNEIPLFFSAYETEIGSPADIQRLAPGRREAESVRLVAKRFINSQTGKSLSMDPAVGRENPPVRTQSLAVRAIRAHAATATIDRYPGKYIRRLYEHVMASVDLDSEAGKPVIIHLMRPGRALYAHDATINFLSVAAQREITESLNNLARLDGASHLIQFVDEKEMPVISRTARSNASPIGRLVQQGKFDVAEVRCGDRMIIVDDHTQAGGTILAMAAAATEAGARVLAAATPTAHPFCHQLSLTPAVKSALTDILNAWDIDGLVRQQLTQFGMPVETLTDHEAMIVIAYATDPADTVGRGRFLSLEQQLSGEHRVMDGESDSLLPILNQRPLSPRDIVAEMLKESDHSRRVVVPTPIRQIHVLDWDDFLRDEKGMNYQLMHNAIAVAARRYREAYPLLDKLAKAVADARGHYRNGLPLLCMTQEEFSQFTIRNDQFVKKEMVTDLLKKMGGLHADLKRQFDRLIDPTVPVRPVSGQKAIENILYHEFSRQYQQMVRPRTAEGSARQGAYSVPFPDVAPEWMPGAEQLLERIRRPENFLALISNRGERDLQKELNKGGWSHYFDRISGTPELTHTDEQGRVQVKRVWAKPNPSRLQNILANEGRFADADLTLWGDTAKDVTQVMPLLHHRSMKGRQVTGVLVNPSPDAAEQARREIESDARTQGRVDIITASTLHDLPADAPGLR